MEVKSYNSISEDDNMLINTWGEITKSDVPFDCWVEVDNKNLKSGDVISCVEQGWPIFSIVEQIPHMREQYENAVVSGEISYKDYKYAYYRAKCINKGINDPHHEFWKKLEYTIVNNGTEILVVIIPRHQSSW